MGDTDGWECMGLVFNYARVMLGGGNGLGLGFA